MRERCETDHQVAEGEETRSNRRKEERAKPRLIPNQEADLVPFWVALILVVMLWAHGFGGEGPSASTQPWSPHPTLWAPILAPGRLTDARLRAEAAGAAWRAGLGDDENHSVAIFNHAWRSRPPRSPPRAAPRPEIHLPRSGGGGVGAQGFGAGRTPAVLHPGTGRYGARPEESNDITDDEIAAWAQTEQQVVAAVRQLVDSQVTTGRSSCKVARAGLVA